jgi:hypothetical protein
MESAAGDPREPLVHLRSQVGEEVIGEEYRHDGAQHRLVDDPGRLVAAVRAAMNAVIRIEAEEALVLANRSAEDHRVAAASADRPDQHLGVEVHAVDLLPTSR